MGPSEERILSGENDPRGVSFLPARMITSLLGPLSLTLLAATGATTAPPAPAPPAAPTAELRGRIVGDGDKPLSHAVVLVLRDDSAAPKSAKVSRVETGDDGGFAALGLTGETFRIRVQAAGYAPLTQPQLPANASVRLRLKRGAKLTGIVKDRATGGAIAGATVLGWDRDADAFGEDGIRKTTTGKDGRFVLEDLLPGKVTVEARSAAHAPSKSPNTVVPKADLELLLDLAGGISGSVTDVVGDPVAGAEVKAFWRDSTGPRSKSAKTGPDGHYRIADAGTKPVSRMAVRAPKFLPYEREGAPPSDGVVDFMLEHPGSIAGIVHAFDGKSPASFKVALKSEDGSSSSAKSEKEFTDPNGAFRLDELEPGTYTIEVAAEHYASASKSSIRVVAEQVADAGTLTLQSRSVMRGRTVAARDRTPVPGVTVHINFVDGPQHPAAGADNSWTVTSGSDGTFDTPALPDGTFDVAIDHPSFAPLRMRIPFHPDADNQEVVLELYRGGSLTGIVTNANSEPVANVRISAAMGPDMDARVADTGSDGHYFIDGLAPGTYSVTRQQERQGTQVGLDTKTAAIREGETTTVDFDESPRVSVSGSVMRGDAPISNASLYWVPVDPNFAHDGTTTKADGGGNYQVGLRHGGKYQVSVVFAVSGNSNGHSVVALTIPEQPQVHQDIVFNISSISGHVLDPDRNGVKGALVTALRDGASAPDAPRQATTMSVDDGSFRLEGIDPGTYRVTARARGFAAAEQYPVTIQDGDPDPNLELNLQRGWMMRGRVVDPQGRAIAGALVVVAPPGAAESGYLPSQTDGAGTFRITAPADGTVNVAAITPRFAPAVQNGIDPPTSDTPPDIVLHATPGGAIRVRVVHRNGDPVPVARVAYQPSPLFPGSDIAVDRNPAPTTDNDGVSRIGMLYPGVYVVSLIGRRDASPVQVPVTEGSEVEAVLEVP